MKSPEVGQLDEAQTKAGCTSAGPPCFPSRRLHPGLLPAAHEQGHLMCACLLRPSWAPGCMPAWPAPARPHFRLPQPRARSSGAILVMMVCHHSW